MRVVYLLGTNPPPTPLGRAVLSIGAFDGVHMAHRRLLARVAKVAAQEDARAVAVVLWPASPADASTADASPHLLTTLDERLALLDGLGLLDAAVVLPTAAASAHSADATLDALSVLCQPLALIEAATSESAILRASAEQRGLRVETLDTASESDAERTSLTALREGNLDAVTQQLGHPYSLSGEVVVGDQRGRLLGFPTANLRLDPRKALPANGVYAVRVGLPGEREVAHPGVCNIGVRPTFGGEPRLLIEVHLLDAALDLYGMTLRTDLIARLRNEQRFDGIDALKAQIARDADTARTLLARPPEREPSMTA